MLTIINSCNIFYVFAELHGPYLQVRGSNSTEGAAVSCSATGRPPPTVTLNVLNPDLNFSNYSSVSVANANGTVTVTETAKLSGPRDSTAQVVCAVQVLSSPQIEVSAMIPAVKHLNADGEKHSKLWFYRLIELLCCSCLLFLFFSFG